MRSSHSTVRFTEEDHTILDAIQAKTGIVSRAEILRRAIRKLAEAEGVSTTPARKSRRARK